MAKKNAKAEAQVVTIKDLEEKYNVEGRKIRMLIRSLGFNAPENTELKEGEFGARKKYTWHEGDKELAAIEKALKNGDKPAPKPKKEKAEKPAKGKGKKAADEEDETDDDEDEAEDSAPKAKKSSKKEEKKPAKGKKAAKAAEPEEDEDESDDEDEDEEDDEDEE